MRHENGLATGSLIQHRYQVRRRLGRGGMATTYLVTDQLWGADVALKLLPPSSPELLDALRFEFAVLRELYHPHLCQVHDFSLLDARSDESEHACFYTADYVPGTTLGKHARSASWHQVQKPLCDALGALRLLHRAGLRHGDFKPANILVRPDGQGVLIDLGCARPIAAPVTHQISGTPEFMAPELIAGEPVDTRADLYALGKTIIELAEICSKGPPKTTKQLARRLLRTRPAERPADVDEVFEALGIELTIRAAVPDGIGRFVGRSRQLSAVGSALDALAAASPDSRVLHIIGPEGVGRSRLLQEVKWQAQQRCRVAEANAARPRAISELLARAADVSETDGVAAVLEMRERFREPEWEPTVLLVDDMHLLEESQRQLLVALARSLEATDPLLLVATSLPEGGPLSSSATRLKLAPLGPTEVDDWLGSGLSKHTRSSLHSVSGGFPAALRAILTELATGVVNETELGKKAHRIPLSKRRIQLVRSLDPAEQRGVAALAILGRPASGGTLEQLSVDPKAMESLAVLGLVTRDALGFKLWRWGESAELLGALEPTLVNELHGQVATWLAKQSEKLGGTDPRRSELSARRVYHLALGGQTEAARRLLLDSSKLAEVSPGSWFKAADALASMVEDPQVQLTAATLERTAGHARSAQRRLVELLRKPQPPNLQSQLQLELGVCHLKLGDAKRAQPELEKAVHAAQDPEHAGSAQSMLAQSLTKQGKYREALHIADRGLDAGPGPVLRAELQQTAGMALSFLGELDQARQRLDEAASLLSSVDHPRRLVRAQGSRALVEYQMGDLAAATEHYKSALQLAESHGLVDQAATAALNFGTVCHQRGDWASALSAYERGLVTAAALGQASTDALLRFNLAKLYADLGLFERAELTAVRCQELAHAANLPLVAAEAEAVRGEVRMARGELEAARGCFERAREQFDQHESARESTEVDLQLAELSIGSGDLQSASRLLEDCARRLDGFEAKDVKLRLALARGRELLARGLAAEAVEAAEEALGGAAQIALADAEAEAGLLLAQAWDAQGSPFLAQKHRARAREIWERAAAPLAVGHKEAFWKHPKRAEARRAREEEPRASGSGREQKLELLLDINKRLNSSLKTGEILERTMDAAIQLTGAERGFVLLVDSSRGPDRLRVAVARNLDREQLGRSHLKFSRAIAEQILETGTPVVTANAQTDTRFSQHESVHAMQLQSVVCTPVLSPAGTLGALYLDNRFQANRFRSEDVELLLAFSDQVAIALNNARLHDELKKRNRELSKERQRVEELLQGQAAEIDRLTEEVQKVRTTPEQRYDYRGIVGTSRSIRDVFALLDRVIETDLPILIQGESGTGKELFARAIHLNNSQRSGPLVSVNCAALPETLLESELFGYERGAFTGADRTREGLLVQARGGTLFLDEVAEMPLPMQVKLLRALQEHEVRPLGSHKVISIDIRLVCATNRRLQEEVSKGTFRADLFYRVAGVETTLPPLRERTEDIPQLVHHLLSQATRRMGRDSAEISAPALRKLMGFSWPGNVRQLENVVTKALVLAEANRITAAYIELPVEGSEPSAGLDRNTYMEREAERISEALAANRWNVAKVARLLGIPRPTLYRKLKRYGIVRQ